MTFQCADCATHWTSRTAADECAVLDGVEARDARRPNPRVLRPMTRWDED